jgi:hypothetical protein
MGFSKTLFLLLPNKGPPAGEVLITPKTIIYPERGQRGPRHRQQAANGKRFFGFCAAARRGAICPNDTAIGIGLRALYRREQAWDPAFETLARSSHPKEHASTIARHQHAAGVKGGPAREALGRSRGGFSTKSHFRTNTKGDPLT